MFILYGRLIRDEFDVHIYIYIYIIYLFIIKKLAMAFVKLLEIYNQVYHSLVTGVKLMQRSSLYRNLV